MHTVAGVLFTLHAIAHLVGVAGAFRLGGKVPHLTTAFFGRFNLSKLGAQLSGIAWLIAAIGFGVAAGGAFVDAIWWPRFVIGAALASLAMCVLYLPDARVGAIVNALVLVVFLFGRSVLWWILRD